MKYLNRKVTIGLRIRPSEDIEGKVVSRMAHVGSVVDSRPAVVPGDLKSKMKNVVVGIGQTNLPS